MNIISSDNYVKVLNCTHLNYWFFCYNQDSVSTKTKTKSTKDTQKNAKPRRSMSVSERPVKPLKQSKRRSKSAEPRVKEARVQLQTRLCLNLEQSGMTCCRECASGTTSPEVCRFWGWRKIDAESSTSAFLDEADILDADCNIWRMKTDTIAHRLKLDTAKIGDPNLSELETHIKIVAYLRDAFVTILAEEKRERDKAKQVYWKRQLENVREICDQCKTSIFNGHYACKDCGFAVCIDCKRTRSSTKKSNTFYITGLRPRITIIFWQQI